MLEKKMESFLLLVHVFCCFAAHGDSAAPAKVLVPVFAKEGDQACPSSQVFSAGMQSLREEIEVALTGSSLQFNCSCGGPGAWRRIAHLNMSDPGQQCPANWNLITSPVRGCGRSSAAASTCDSAIFPASGRSYSQVCGRVNGYEKGTPNAFNGSIPTAVSLEGAYIDGVSLTHGAAGSRQHIWSFAAAYNDEGPDKQWQCDCIRSNENWLYQLPSYIGNNYFCATGNPGSTNGQGTQVFADDPLWDGKGCSPTNACCQFNTPPWFCTTLPRPTTDDLELRVCHDQDADNEDVVISLVEIAVM